jgi:hypothetical protein
MQFDESQPIDEVKIKTVTLGGPDGNPSLKQETNIVAAIEISNEDEEYGTTEKNNNSEHAPTIKEILDEALIKCGINEELAMKRVREEAFLHSGTRYSEATTAAFHEWEKSVPTTDIDDNIKVLSDYTEARKKLLESIDKCLEMEEKTTNSIDNVRETLRKTRENLENI